jgi:D-arabinitol dehydrogenase (NADP+)
MRALTIERPRSIRIETLDPPVLKADELLVRVAACGICGTDLHIYEGSYMGDYPVVPGHEFAGTVEATGPGVRRFAPGHRVAVEPNVPCNNCPQCLNNRQNFCENWQAVGVTRPGAMAEYVVVPEPAAFAIGDLPFEEASFVEPLSCVLHGVQKLAIEPGAHAAVVGAGPIGLLLMRTLRACGVTGIDAAERNPSRRQFAAEALGIRVVPDAADLEPDRYDIVVDATGVPEAMAGTLRIARPGGEVLWFGVPDTNAVISFAPFAVFRKGLSIYGSFTSVRNTLQAIELLSSGSVPVADLVTHRVGLDDVEDVLRMLGGTGGDARKVLVLPEHS